MPNLSVTNTEAVRVERPAIDTAATAVIRHLRTGPAQAKPPQQPLSACARDDGS
eukprot:COSAG05_NODE_24563_length_248_cov_12.416107_1_plen_53_part_10